MLYRQRSSAADPTATSTTPAASTAAITAGDGGAAPSRPVLLTPTSWVSGLSSTTPRSVPFGTIARGRTTGATKKTPRHARPRTACEPGSAAACVRSRQGDFVSRAASAILIE